MLLEPTWPRPVLERGSQQFLFVCSEMEACVVDSVSSKQQWNWAAGDPGCGRYGLIFFHHSSEGTAQSKAFLSQLTVTNILSIVCPFSSNTSVTPSIIPIEILLHKTSL